jgi:hypothetical protein
MAGTSPAMTMWIGNPDHGSAIVGRKSGAGSGDSAQWSFFVWRRAVFLASCY